MNLNNAKTRCHTQIFDALAEQNLSDNEKIKIINDLAEFEKEIDGDNLKSECANVRTAFVNLVIVLLEEGEHLLNKLKRRIKKNGKCK